jgi:putative ATP-binding cassette transporter
MTEREAVLTGHGDSIETFAAHRQGSVPVPLPGRRLPHQGGFGEMRDLVEALWQSPARRVIGWLLTGLVVVIALNMVGQVRLNAWHGAFFDALEQKDAAAFGYQLLVFLGLVAVLLCLVVGQTWLHEMMKIRLREWLTNHLLDLWGTPKRAYQLGHAGQIGVNPDQRLQHDIAQLTELSSNLGVGLLHASLQLVSFIGVLWYLSSDVVFAIGGQSFTIPGYMVWCAILYAAAGSWLTWLVGKPMIALNAQLYAREADFRFALVRMSEHAEAVSLVRGERDERGVIDGRFGEVILAMRRLCFALARLTWITSGYGWLTIVVPAVVASPGYFSGGLTLGGLMMVVGAFNHVHWALRWFVERFPQIADWRASLLRVAALRNALIELEASEGDTRIEHVERSNSPITLDRLTLELADGKVLIRDVEVEIRPGDRVLIVGRSGIGKSTLFRAIGGIWPWGKGRITRPPEREMMFVPQHPYLPLGTLRAAIAYPAPAEAFSEERVKRALERVGLAAFTSQIEAEERWDQELSLGEQQRLAFARLLLHRPKWAFLDEATAALDADNERQLLSLFDQELRDTSIISIGHHASLEAFHNRVLQLVAAPDGARLVEGA